LPLPIAKSGGLAHVVAAVVEEALLESEGGFKELKGGGDVGDVDDGVAEFHGLGGGVINSIKPHPPRNLERPDERPDERPENTSIHLGFKPQAIG
jgi:hypothetical protein